MVKHTNVIPHVAKLSLCPSCAIVRLTTTIILTNDEYTSACSSINRFSRSPWWKPLLLYVHYIIHMHVCTYRHVICVYIYWCIWKYTCVLPYTHLCTSNHIYRHVCTYMHIHTCISLDICTYLHTFTYPYDIFIYLQILAHIYTHKLIQCIGMSPTHMLYYIICNLAVVHLSNCQLSRALWEITMSPQAAQNLHRQFWSCHEFKGQGHVGSQLIRSLNVKNANCHVNPHSRFAHRPG